MRVVKCIHLHLDESMRKASSKSSIAPQSPNLTIREYHQIVKGKGYLSYLVQGWKEDRKWQRRKFKLRADAERFVALKIVELQNEGRSQRMVLSPLSDEQTQQAVEAFDLLGDTYSLVDAVQYFLENHREPGFSIKLSEGLKLYLGEKVHEGIRSRSIKQSESVINLFISAAKDPLVHEVTQQDIQEFLRGLRSKDGLSPAKRKTWNNYRNDLHQFFFWAGQEDLVTQRPWVFNNPVQKIRVFTAKQIAEQRPEIVTTTPENLQHMLSVLMRWRDGVLVKSFILAYFAGIRPDGELKRLAPREKELINLKTGIISIPAVVSKTKEARQVTIAENLALWLKAYADMPIIPKNFDRLMKQARAHFELSHDETRHSFISFHVALHRSVGDAALQAGNSESIVKKHYLNLHPKIDGKNYFSLVPDIQSKLVKLGI